MALVATFGLGARARINYENRPPRDRLGCGEAFEEGARETGDKWPYGPAFLKGAR